MHLQQHVSQLRFQKQLLLICQLNLMTFRSTFAMRSCNQLLNPILNSRKHLVLSGESLVRSLHATDSLRRCFLFLCSSESSLMHFKLLKRNLLILMPKSLAKLRLQTIWLLGSLKHGTRLRFFMMKMLHKDIGLCSTLTLLNND